MSGPDEIFYPITKNIRFCANDNCPNRSQMERDYAGGKAILHTLVQVRIADKRRRGPFQVTICHDCYKNAGR